MFGLKTNLYQWLIVHCIYWTSFHILQNSFGIKRKEKTEKRKEKQKIKRKRKKAHSHWAKWPLCRPSPLPRRPLPTAHSRAPLSNTPRAHARAPWPPLPRGRQRVAATAAHMSPRPDPPGSPSLTCPLSSLCPTATERYRRHGRRLAAATVPLSLPRRVHELRRPRLRRLHRRTKADDHRSFVPEPVFLLCPDGLRRRFRPHRAFPEPAATPLRLPVSPPSLSLSPCALAHPLASPRPSRAPVSAMAASTALPSPYGLACLR
jgi:hypothetical protein